MKKSKYNMMRSKDKKFLGIDRNNRNIYSDGIFYYAISRDICNGIFPPKNFSKWITIKDNPLEENH